MERVDTFRCGHTRAPENRAPRGDGKGCGYGCKVCKSARTKKWLKAHPEHSRQVMQRIRRKRVERLAKEQNGCCAICEEPLRHPYLDHDHRCCPLGKSCDKCRRGLLCPDCNQKLAALEKPGWLEKAWAYLDKWNRLSEANHNATDGSPAE